MKCYGNTPHLDLELSRALARTTDLTWEVQVAVHCAWLNGKTIRKPVAGLGPNSSPDKLAAAGLVSVHGGEYCGGGEYDGGGKDLHVEALRFRDAGADVRTVRDALRFFGFSVNEEFTSPKLKP